MSKAWHASAAFKRRLLALPKKVLKDTNAAIEKNADEWVKTSRSMAPVDPKDGIHLRPSIRHYDSETGGQIVRAGGETTTRTMSDGSTFDYAIGQEFGTVGFNGQPYFWPAYRLLRKKFRGRRARAMSKAIKDFNNGR